MANNTRKLEMTQTVRQLKQWAQKLGFQQLGISKPNLSMHKLYLTRWLENNYQADMHYMARHGRKRTEPDRLVPNALSVISVRIDYYPTDTTPKKLLNQNISNKNKAVIATYAHGKDYHKLIRKRLTQLAKRLQEHIGPFGYRAFADSAPVLERAIANQAGLGWIGKNAMLINNKAGSLFFLGEIYTDLDLPTDTSASAHCGSCRQCIDICPTQAIRAPYQLDARRCISYLTIEYKGVIPEPLRPLIGNRIFGCDDCQLICPWNKFAKKSEEQKFVQNHKLKTDSLYELFNLTEQQYLDLTEGSVLRRPGYENWLRNLAIALGNSTLKPTIRQKLIEKREKHSDFVKIHLDWALEQQK